MATLAVCTVDPCSLSRQQERAFIPKATSLHSNKLHTHWLPFYLPAPHRKGQLHCQVKAVKPSGCAAPASPEISMLSPELQQQWHFRKNMHLGAIKVKAHSSIKAVWQCDRCPAGQPHVWTAAVDGRTRGAQCHIAAIG
ncbi:hypothetical protein ABBQ38_004361 [Trebouxia sp. C0009 RCD-2024]